MGALFIKKDTAPVWHDECTVAGRKFDVELRCERRGGHTRSIQGGCITYFLMSEANVPGFNDCAICYYDNGHWEMKCPEEDDEACIAQTYFINKWNRARLRNMKGNNEK